MSDSTGIPVSDSAWHRLFQDIINNIRWHWVNFKEFLFCYIECYSGYCVLIELHAFSSINFENRLISYISEHCFLRILTGKKHHQIKLHCLQKVQILAFGLLAGLEISVGHQTMTDSNKCLTDLKLLYSDIMSERKTKTM